MDFLNLPKNKRSKDWQVYGPRRLFPSSTSGRSSIHLYHVGRSHPLVIGPFIARLDTRSMGSDLSIILPVVLGSVMGLTVRNGTIMTMSGHCPSEHKLSPRSNFSFLFFFILPAPLGENSITALRFHWICLHLEGSIMLSGNRLIATIPTYMNDSAHVSLLVAVRLGCYLTFS